MEMMKVDPESIRKLREQRAWSQEHLAAAAGLSLRTVQRVESKANASAETRMALAAAFGVDLESLNPPGLATTENPSSSSVQGASSALPPARPEPAKPLSQHSYRLLRLLVIVSLPVGIDVHKTGSITWSRWILVVGIALCVLRLIKTRFVEPGTADRRHSAPQQD